MKSGGLSMLKDSRLDRAVAEIVEQLADRVQAGETITTEVLFRDYPEHADQLGRLLPAVQALAALDKSGQLSSFPPQDGDPASGALGDFQIIRELGRGGMGIVYEAEQISLCRRVALKVLPFAATMDPRQLQRFRNEAQAAACLHHPNIVPVHGVGCERGVHYYAMQLIEGQTLAEVIKNLTPRPPSRSGKGEDDLLPSPPASGGEGMGVRGVASTAPNALLSTKRDRAHFRHIAALIASAADALEYAHSMGVVHRDIKPGNLMLDNSPSPRAGEGQGGGLHLWITDFGLAKLASPADPASLRRQPGELTLTGDLIGTLRYMSPEQALAKHGLVDHRTDIYSLGATLYELLTLHPAVPGDDKGEILKAIAWDDPTPLRKLDKSIPAELETITLKCLAKEPSERYATAGEMAEDLRRWVEHKPIRAKPPTLLDRAGKWAGRNSRVVGLTIAFLVFAILGVTSALVFVAKKQHETQLANEKAERRLNQLENGNHLLRLIFANLDPFAEESGGPTLRQQLKNNLLEAAQKLEGEVVGDELIVAKMQTLLATSLDGFGDPASALRLNEKAVVAYETHFGRSHPYTLTVRSSLAGNYSEVGRSQDALRMLEGVRDDCLTSLGNEHPCTIDTEVKLASVYLDAQRYPDAIRVYEQLRMHCANDRASKPARLGSILSGLGLAYRDSGRISDCITPLEQALDIGITDFGPSHPYTLTAKINLGDAYRRAGRLTDAIELLESVRDSVTKKLGPEHNNTLVASANLALAYKDVGRYAEAIRIFQQVHEIRARKFGPDHPETLRILLDLAASHHKAGFYPEAIRLRNDLREPLAKAYGARHEISLKNLERLVQAYLDSDQIKEATVVYEELTDRRGSEELNVSVMVHNFALHLHAAGSVADAIPLYEKARELAKKCFDPNSAEPFKLELNLARAYRDLHRLKDAISSYEIAWRGLESASGANDELTTSGMLELAQVYRECNRLSDAEPLLRDLLARMQPTRSDDWRTFNRKSLLGAVLLGQKKYAESEPILIEGYQGIKQREAAVPREVRTIRLTEAVDRVIKLYGETNRPDEAARWKAEREEMLESLKKDAPK